MSNPTRKIRLRCYLNTNKTRFLRRGLNNNFDIYPRCVCNVNFFDIQGYQIKYLTVLVIGQPLILTPIK